MSEKININAEDIGRIDRHKIPDNDIKVYKKFDGVPYLGSIETDMTESCAGSLKVQGVTLLDLWHKAEGDEQKYLELLSEEAEHEMADQYIHAANALKELELFLTEIDTDALAEEMINHKMIDQVALGGEVERLSANLIAEEWNAKELLLTESAIAAETGIRNPESEGIDVALVMDDDEIVTLQIKFDGGGDDPYGNTADYLVRTFRETGRVRVEKNE